MFLNPDNIPTDLIESKIWKKTNLFGLFYDITIPDDTYDRWGTPYTKRSLYIYTRRNFNKVICIKEKNYKKHFYQLIQELLILQVKPFYLVHIVLDLCFLQM